MDKYNLPEPPVIKTNTAPYEDKIKEWVGRKGFENVGTRETISETPSVVSPKRKRKML